MARKVTFNTDSSLGQFIAKLNLEADYVGDLDNLHVDILDGRTFFQVNIPGIRDSSYTVHGVSLTNALNWIESGFTVVTESFTSGTAQIVVDGLSADSAIFNKVTVGNLLTDSDFLILDSAEFIRTSGYTLDFDSANIDSARIDYLSGSYINYDSGWGATEGAPYWPGQDALGFNILRNQHITADSSIYTNISGNTINYPAARVSQLFIDSVAAPDLVADHVPIGNLNGTTANITGDIQGTHDLNATTVNITNGLQVTNLNGTTANITGDIQGTNALNATTVDITNGLQVTNLTVNTLNFDSKALDEATVLRLTDNNGTIQLAGYLTSTDNDSAVA